MRVLRTSFAPALQQQEYPGVLGSWEDSGIARIFGCGSSEIASSQRKMAGRRVRLVCPPGVIARFHG